jgi:hypothetical protein
MEKETTKEGLVGFFDILGYQNLLERNEPEKIAEEVLPILTNIGEKIASEMKELLSNVIEKDLHKNYFHRIIENLHWLVFSDTVLLTLPIEEENHILVKYIWLIFILAVISIQGELFVAGLPPRGVIDYGKFFIKDTCFAGRPIVNAYKLCSQIELSACIFSEYAAEKIRKMEDWENFFDSFIVEYLIPTKKGEKHLLTVMAHTYDKDSPAIHNEVMRAFWKNSKDISLDARQKAQNTEQWLEFLEYRLKIEKNKDKPIADS